MLNCVVLDALQWSSSVNFMFYSVLLDSTQKINPARYSLRFLSYCHLQCMPPMSLRVKPIFGGKEWLNYQVFAVIKFFIVMCTGLPFVTILVFRGFVYLW